MYQETKLSFFKIVGVQKSTKWVQIWSNDKIISFSYNSLSENGS